MSFAVSSNRCTACIGVNLPVESRMAIAADTWGAACDVPARYAYSSCASETQYDERMAFASPSVGSSPPGAAMPHLASPTPLAYVGLLSSRSVALTTTAGSSVNPEPVTNWLPADTTQTTPALHASRTASVKLGPKTGWRLLPSERLTTLAPWEIAHRMPSTTASASPSPASSSTRTGRIF